MDLKPKVLVIGQGLWYGISHPPAKFGTKFENYYRNDLRRQLDKLVGILKKVDKHSTGLQCSGINICVIFSVQLLCDLCQAIPVSKDGGVAWHMRIRGQNE